MTLIALLKNLQWLISKGAHIQSTFYHKTHFLQMMSYTTYSPTPLQTVLNFKKVGCIGSTDTKTKELQNETQISQHHSEHAPFFNIAKSNTEHSSTTQSSQPKLLLCAQFTPRKEHHESSSWVGRQALSKHISKQRTIEMIPENIVLSIYRNSICIPFCCASPLKWFCVGEFCGL